MSDVQYVLYGSDSLGVSVDAWRNDFKEYIEEMELDIEPENEIEFYQYIFETSFDDTKDWREFREIEFANNTFMITDVEHGNMCEKAYKEFADNKIHLELEPNKKTLDIADNVLQKTGIGKSIDDYDFERLMHLDSCMRVHLKGHDDYELKLVANPALSMEQVRTLTAILKLGGLTKDEMTYVADPYNSPKAMEYISSAICSGLPLKEAVIVAEILNFRPDELEK